MFSETNFIRMSDNVELHAQIHEVDAPAWLIVTHGIGEHLERHSYMRELFGRDFNILMYDLRGHGRSLGESATISDFDLYRKDLIEIIRYLKNRYKMNSYVLFGHSMGALITAGVLKNYKSELAELELAYLNAPPAGFPPPLGMIHDNVPVQIFEKLASLKASFRIGGTVDLTYLSHDPQVKEKYTSDPLNCLKLHTKLLIELAKDSKHVFSSPIDPGCQAFVSWGSEDRIVSPSHLKEYFAKVETTFDVKEFDGAYHEIHNEIEKYRIPYFQHLQSCIKQALKTQSFKENIHE